MFATAGGDALGLILLNAMAVATSIILWLQCGGWRVTGWMRAAADCVAAWLWLMVAGRFCFEMSLRSFDCTIVVSDKCYYESPQQFLEFYFRSFPFVSQLLAIGVQSVQSRKMYNPKHEFVNGITCKLINLDFLY